MSSIFSAESNKKSISNSLWFSTPPFRPLYFSDFLFPEDLILLLMTGLSSFSVVITRFFTTHCWWEGSSESLGGRGSDWRVQYGWVWFRSFLGGDGRGNVQIERNRKELCGNDLLLSSYFSPILGIGEPWEEEGKRGGCRKVGGVQVNVFRSVSVHGILYRLVSGVVISLHLRSTVWSIRILTLLFSVRSIPSSPIYSPEVHQFRNIESIIWEPLFILS